MLQIKPAAVRGFVKEGKLRPVSMSDGKEFAAEDLFDFLLEHVYLVPQATVVSAVTEDGEILHSIILSDQYQILVSVCSYVAIHGNDGETLALFTQLMRHGLTFPMMIDEVLSPAVTRIRTLSTRGKISEEEKQIACTTLCGAIDRLAATTTAGSTYRTETLQWRAKMIALSLRMK